MAETAAEPGLPITAVTVFKDGARVQRRGSVSVQAGLRPVVLGNLPPTVDPASVRVGVGGEGVALVNVEVHQRHRTDPLRAEAARLRFEVDELRDAVQVLDDEDAAERARLDFLGHLSEAAATALARAVSFGRAGRDDLTGMAAHLSTDTAGALGRRRDIAQRARSARRELDAAQNRLAAAEKRDGHSVRYVEVSVTLEASAATQAQVELSYHVTRASWRPLYDLVLDEDRLDVSYLAEVTQRTGEDWPAVGLTLSTTRRGLHETLPELTPWYVSPARPIMPRVAGVGMRSAMAVGGVPPGSGAGEENIDEALALSEGSLGAALAAEPAEAGAGQSYRLPRPLAVPADGGPHKALVARFGLDASLDHLAVPVLAQEAYLRATVTNSSSLLLLPGPARVFQGSRFVGETALETVAAGEEFELQLGVDDQIRVERELRRRAASKAVIGGSRTVDVGYEITVENHRQGQARVSLHDHIPVSTDGEIKVRLREASPDPAEQDDLGELIWDLRLEPGQKAVIRYRFTVEHPAQVVVEGM